jgi:tRNA (guanine37-N1)-methyltransferase
MKISIITLFPEIFEPILNSSILKRAQNKNKVSFELINLREFGEGKHQVVDDRPYGGGSGMVLKVDSLSAALKSITSKLPKSNYRLITLLTSASGKTYKQSKARELSKLDHIIIVCGHYEGVDERFIEKFVDEEVPLEIMF